jgi:hypothetical protein
MAIGTASVILVVTISLTSRDYILEQVQGIGSNIIFAYYASAGGSTVSEADYIKMPDVLAIRQELTSDIVAATGVMSNFDRILIGGKEQDVKVIGTDQDYQAVRNIVISSGRFLDDTDLTMRAKAGLLTDQLATRMFGGRAAALSQTIKLYGLEFTVIGTFHEKVETFGQSEVERDTILIPITVLRYFTPVERIDPLYVQVRSPQEVDRVAVRVQEILEGRHRPGARYRVDTMTAILTAAKNISLILSLVLVMILVAGETPMGARLAARVGSLFRQRPAFGPSLQRQRVGLMVLAEAASPASACRQVNVVVDDVILAFLRHLGLEEIRQVASSERRWTTCPNIDQLFASVEISPCHVRKRLCVVAQIVKDSFDQALIFPVEAPVEHRHAFPFVSCERSRFIGCIVRDCF